MPALAPAPVFLSLSHRTPRLTAYIAINSCPLAFYAPTSFVPELASIHPFTFTQTSCYNISNLTMTMKYSLALALSAVAFQVASVQAANPAFTPQCAVTCAKEVAALVVCQAL